MAKNVEPVEETMVDTESGLVLRADPFGGSQHDILDVLNPDDWEMVEEDFGPVIDWPTMPTVAGRLVNQKTVMIDHEDSRGESATNIYCLQHAVTGERMAFYGNYQIDNALGCNPPEAGKRSPYLGRTVFIRWQGKREQGKGGRTLNVYTVAVKKEPIG